MRYKIVLDVDICSHCVDITTLEKNNLYATDTLTQILNSDSDIGYIEIESIMRVDE